MRYIQLFEKFNSDDNKISIDTKLFDGFKLFMSSNPKSSDKLTREIAEPNDLWINLDDLSLNHYVLRVGRYQPNSNLLKEVAKFILKREKIKDKNILVYCKCKFVKRSEESEPGKVEIDRVNCHHITI